MNGLMLDGVEIALDNFMQNLPLDYRTRALPEQPDVVWGEQILPNFRATYQYLCQGLALLEGCEINNSITCASGSPVSHPGIYLPNIENSCAQFLSWKYGLAPAAVVVTGTKSLLHPTTGVQYGVEDTYDEADCIWTLVERYIGVSTIPSIINAPIRIISGELCPQSGYYFSSAKLNSRKWCDKDTVIPDSKSDYGATIWQWDTNQRAI